MYATATNSRWTDRKQFSKLHQPLPTMILLHTSRESHFLTPSTMKGSENGFTAALPASAFSLFSKKKRPFQVPRFSDELPEKKYVNATITKIYIYILYTHYTILYVSVYIIYMYICDTLIIDTYRISYNMQVRKINNVGLPASSPTHGLISK